MASNPGLDSEYKTLPLPAGAAQRIVAEFVRTDSRRTALGSPCKSNYGLNLSRSVQIIS
jgi:hypothetical protein